MVGLGDDEPTLVSVHADVSVVIAARNARAVVGSALASIAGQSVQPAQVVVVDDGSTDDTADVVISWSTRLPVLLLRNGLASGPGQARARGAACATGRLLTFLDADDVLLPTHLEELLRVHTRHGGIVTSDALIWSAAAGKVSGTFHENRPVPEPTDQRRGILGRNFLLIGSLVEREAYLTVGGFRAEHDGAEDWDLWIRLIFAGHAVHRSATTYVYRQSKTSLSRDLKTAAASLALVEATMRSLDGDELLAAQTSRRAWLVQVHRISAVAKAGVGDWEGARREALTALRHAPGRPDVRALLIALSPRWAAAMARSRAQERWERNDSPGTQTYAPPPAGRRGGPCAAADGGRVRPRSRR